MGFELFQNEKFTKTESDVFLQSVVGYLSVGFPLLKAVEMTGENFKGNLLKSKFHIISEKIKNDNINNNIPISEVLYMYGVLTDEEVNLFTENSSKTVDSIIEIIALRKYGSKYEKTITSWFWSTYTMTVATMLGMFIYGEDLVNLYQESYKNVKHKVIFELNDILPYYLLDKYTLIYMIIITTIIPLSIALLYKYYMLTNKKIIYQIFKNKPWDDLPKMFQVMSNMKKVNKTTKQIFEHMAEADSYKGQRELFEALSNGELAREKKYLHFEDAHFPRDIVSLIRAKEETDFWLGIDSMIQFSKDRERYEYEKLERRFSNFSLFLPWVAPTIVMLDVTTVYGQLMVS